MIFFPAIDIQGGKAVRLHQGRKEEATIFADDPLKMASQWLKQGAQWLHIVDLDGAFAGNRANFEIVAAICSLGLPCQIGGGIRTRQDAQFYLDAGAKRLIIGTIALENPVLFRELCQEWPGQIGVSLDAQNGRLKTRGWLKDAGATASDVLPDLEQSGAAFVIYTDISRDGTRLGPNLDGLQAILSSTRLPVIAAGGIANLTDIQAIASLRNYANLEGVISGRAIYDGSLDVASAITCLKNA